MQATSTDPHARHSPRILNIRPSLQLAENETKNHPFCSNLPPLSFLLLADRLAELYEITFPAHPEWLQENIVDWVDEEAVAASVEQFLQRVNSLFPVHNEIWDMDIEAIEWRLYEIPVLPLGFDYWHDGWEHLPEPIPYLLSISHSRGNDYYSEQNEFADEYPQHLVPRALEPHRLVETLKQICAERCATMIVPDPLTALPDLILMLNQSIGNVWLDVGECALAESGGYPIWSPENVAWLTTEWQQAQPLWDKIMALLNWKSDTPEATVTKITAVHNLLLEAHQRMPKNDPTTTTPP